LLLSCSKPESNTLFTKLSETETGITYRNLLKEDYPDFNIIFYPYFYNGGGVAVGDLNNDGLKDIFFTGNMVKNRLFVNKGNLEFEDVTVASHVADNQGWCTGTTMVDINEDGWLDIYVCRTALENKKYRKNLLFINNRDLTFTESAASYGLDNDGYSTQASFFDYDRDGDLDMFLINQSKPEFSRGQLDYNKTRTQVNEKNFQNRLFRNDNKKFNDVTDSAGIKSNIFTFSLGVNTTDINQDGWPDIYIANDFKEPDYYYINNQDGTFTDKLAESMGHNSLYAMGVDVADYNNDLLPDVVVLDMLPEDNAAQKMHMGGDNFTQYNHLFRNGMFPQFMKNCLQKNNGDGTFSEIGQLAGISNTDWSWSPLFADFDNDGMKDLFITNGYKRDNTDIQFIVYQMDQSLKISNGAPTIPVPEYISHMPGIHKPNYIYSNAGGDHFVNKIKEWGFDHNTYSHGAAYADLDNDGDLDLITSNTDEYAGIYRNNSEKNPSNHFLSIALKGPSQNASGIGAKIFAYAGGRHFYLEQNPVRGFQSSSDQVLHLGLGSTASLDSVVVVWPNAKIQRLTTVSSNRTLTLNYSDAVDQEKQISSARIFVPLPDQIDYIHQENTLNDFTMQFLLPHFYSNRGPCVAKGDVNGDGLEDLFVGGAREQSGELWIQNKKGTLQRLHVDAFVKDAMFEDQAACFFDADGDKDLDLYVVHGGYEFVDREDMMVDKLYLNNGKGVFTSMKVTADGDANASLVSPADIDSDGDIDLFIGGHVAPGQYPNHTSSKILLNDSKGKFTDATEKWCAPLKDAGIINAATWTDLNGDGTMDLILAGEWTTIKIYLNKHSSLADATQQYFSATSSGWWTSLAVADFDKDGDMDLIAGNYGRNSQLKVDSLHPLTLYALDIDKNGSVDPIITHYIGDASYPLIPRDDLLGQVPSLKKKFVDYNVYAKATINEILSADQMKDSKTLSASNFNTTYFENKGGRFQKRSLPIEAQYAPVQAILTLDANHDGNLDVILAGNSMQNRIYLARHDANPAMLFIGDGKGNLSYVPQHESGFQVKGEVRNMTMLGNKIFFGINNAAMKVYGSAEAR
jgi:hypothetical protein